MPDIHLSSQEVLRYKRAMTATYSCVQTLSGPTALVSLLKSFQQLG